MSVSASASHTLTLETSMTDSTVFYTTDWNLITRRPTADHDWIDEGRAKNLYVDMLGLDVVDAAEVDGDGIPRQRWSLGIGTSGRIRASFFTPQNTLWRQVDWNAIDGRLWRWVTVDYTYPTETQTWAQDEWVRKVEATVEPDGQGDILTVDPSKPAAERRQYTDFSGRARDSYWLDRPEFGDWRDLADPGPSAHEVAGFSQLAG